MTLEQSIPAVRNIHTKVIFVLVDGSVAHRTTIINPEGKLLTVPDGLFEEPFYVKETEFDAHFTAQQKGAIAKYFKKTNPKLSKKSVDARSNGVLIPKKRPSSPLSRKPTRLSSMTTLAAACEWTSHKLTFYKHKIDPLHDQQFFRIHLEDGRSYKIKKADFLREFNDVVVSDEYWRDGSFTYNDVPEKADKFSDLLKK